MWQGEYKQRKLTLKRDLLTHGELWPQLQQRFLTHPQVRLRAAGSSCAASLAESGESLHGRGVGGRGRRPPPGTGLPLRPRQATASSHRRLLPRPHGESRRTVVASFRNAVIARQNKKQKNSSLFYFRARPLVCADEITFLTDSLTRQKRVQSVLFQELWC